MVNLPRPSIVLGDDRGLRLLILVRRRRECDGDPMNAKTKMRQIDAVSTAYSGNRGGCDEVIAHPERGR